MDLWPPNSWIQDASVEGKGKGKSRGEKNERSYPLVDQGNITAANLHLHDGRLEWTFLTQDHPGRKVVAERGSRKVFPASWLRPTCETISNVKQRAEQGAHFLRTYYPDVDIASDLIRDELEADARLSAKLHEFDPQVGNLLTSFTCYERTRKKSLYLAFPMGETASDLYTPPFRSSECTLLKPNATPDWRFSTPIQQLASCDGHISGAHGAYLAVRTFGITTLFGINTHAEGIQMQPLINVSRTDVGDRPIVDMMLSGNAESGAINLLTVNERGDIYSTKSGRVRQTMHCDSVHGQHDQFWRLSPTAESNTVLLLSSTNLELLDFRTENHSLDILSRLPPGHVLTAVEGLDSEHMIRVVSTNQLLWMDQRYPQRPLLAVKHGRRAERTLQSHTLILENRPITLLTSAKRGLVTIYDASRGQDGFIHLNTPPYPLKSALIPGTGRVGCTFIRHPSQLNDQNASMLELSDDGSLHCTELHLSDDTLLKQTHSPCVKSRERTSEDEGAHGSTPRLASYQSPFSRRNFSEVDLESIYQRIFGMDSSSPNPEDAEAAYEVLQSMETFWQDLDAPVDHILTTFDIAFRAGREPSVASRADFFTESALNSKRGLRALMQERIPANDLAKGAAWHHNMLPSLQCFVPELNKSPPDTVRDIEQYDLLHDDFRPGPSLRMEIESREQLTLDLALSGDAFSPHPLRNEEAHEDLNEALETMSRATEVMTIGIPEPKDVHFGFLRPIQRRAIDHYTGGGDRTSTGRCPLGVRLLLQEWEIGSDPGTYFYTDPYDSLVSSVPLTQSKPKKVSAQTLPGPPPVVASPQSPTQPVVQSKEVPASYSQNIARTISSQPIHLDDLNPPSQELLYTSTQVMPGPFGGRLTVSKKPVKKKRLGGF